MCSNFEVPDNDVFFRGDRGDRQPGGSREVGRQGGSRERREEGGRKQGKKRKTRGKSKKRGRERAGNKKKRKGRGKEQKTSLKLCVFAILEQGNCLNLGQGGSREKFWYPGGESG